MPGLVPSELVAVAPRPPMTGVYGLDTTAWYCDWEELLGVSSGHPFLSFRLFVFFGFYGLITFDFLIIFVVFLGCLFLPTVVFSSLDLKGVNYG